jgi:protein-tyrosine phosphatase
VSVGIGVHERHLPLRAIFNFRDLGGYETYDARVVRWRTLYRADGVQRLDGDDLERVRALGIRTVLDLRTRGEIEARGRFPVETYPVTYHHLPLLEFTWDLDTLDVDSPAAQFLADRYLEMLVEGEAAIATALSVLAGPQSCPLLFHCAAGKDRTGVLAAAILSLLGVSDDDIVRDYALSREGMRRLTFWLEANAPDAAAVMAEQPAPFLSAPPAAMRLFLRAVRSQHGSMRNYAASIGVREVVLQRVRQNLLTSR